MGRKTQLLSSPTPPSLPEFDDRTARMVRRKAMQLAVDTDQINRTVYGGALETPHGYFPATFPYSDPTLVFPSPNQAEAQRLVNDYVQHARQPGAKHAVAVFVGISVVVQLTFWVGEAGQSQLIGPLLVKLAPAPL